MALSIFCSPVRPGISSLLSTRHTRLVTGTFRYGQKLVCSKRCYAGLVLITTVKAVSHKQPSSTAPLPGRKRGPGVGKTKRGKGSKIMAITTKDSRPYSKQVISATPFETTLVEQTFKRRFSKARIGKLVGDKAYDSDPLDKRMKRRGVNWLPRTEETESKHKMEES